MYLGFEVDFNGDCEREANKRTVKINKIWRVGAII